MRRLRLLFVLAAAMLPFAAGAQTYVSDYQVATYTSSFSSIAYTGTEVTFTENNYYTQQVTLPFTLTLKA